MTLISAQRIEAGFLKLAVDIAGIGKVAAHHGVTPFLEQPESGMRYGIAVQRQPMSVETPGTTRVAVKGRRCRNIREGSANRPIIGARSLTVRPF